MLVKSVRDTQPDFNELCKAGHRPDRMMEPVSLSNVEGGSCLAQTSFSVLRQVTCKV